MLFSLMQVSIQVTFAKSKFAYDDLGVPGWVEVFDLGGDRFFPLTCSATLWFPDSTNVNVATCQECIDRKKYMAQERGTRSSQVLESNVA